MFRHSSGVRIVVYIAGLCHVTSTICFRQESFHRAVQVWTFFYNRMGASFESNHVPAMKQYSPVDRTVLLSTSRKISFAGGSAVDGMSEKKPQ